jgi:Lrp/AsnC family transcriptional regulator for asnA, asnC and gidA
MASIRSKSKTSRKPRARATPFTPQKNQQEFDELTRDILALLREDGRRTFSSIARELKVSEGAVRSRVSYLEEHEHLRFIAVIDPVQVGYMCWAMLGITVQSNVSPHELALELSKNPNTIWVGIVGGRYDIMVETWMESPAHLQAFLEDYCYGTGKVASIETMLGMRIYKWGAPLP